MGQAFGSLKLTGPVVSGYWMEKVDDQVRREAILHFILFLLVHLLVVW